jgi:hypothetical protein
MSKILKLSKIQKIVQMSPNDIETLLKSEDNKGKLQIEEMVRIFKENIDKEYNIDVIAETIKKYYVLTYKTKTKIKKVNFLTYKNKTLNDILYDYIVNNDNLQDIMRNVMHNAIQNKKQDFLDDFRNMTYHYKLRICDDAIMEIIIKWYDNLYNMGGLFKYQCVGIIQNKLTTYGYREQIYEMMVEYLK